MHPPDWLTTCLTRHQGAAGLTANEVAGAVAVSIEGGEVFRLTALSFDSPRDQ